MRALFKSAFGSVIAVVVFFAAVSFFSVRSTRRMIVTQAEEAVRDDPECSYLVRMGALSVDYTTLARSDFDYDIRRSPMSESASRQRRELAASVFGR